MCGRVGSVVSSKASGNLTLARQREREIGWGVSKQNGPAGTYHRGKAFTRKVD